ncbi:MAG: Rpn family recombination-promoting nuclease/putative transposase [Lachnospiraceae bacterium]|nr:Rpn family recombination-promoting nuclease/putative transposase [Lachnospiraceae bacterium]
MAEKDTLEKALIARNDVFADIVNNLLFQGEQYIKESELEQGRERSYYGTDKSIREQERDVSKYWKQNNLRIAYIGIENQAEAEDDMPLRVISYDGAAYRDQIGYDTDDNRKRIRAKSRFPVVSLVLYFGYKKHWDKAKTLHEALGDRIDERLKPYINDYEIKLFEIAYLTEKQLAGFKSDFRFVADYFVQKRKTGTYIGSMEKVRHIREVLQLLSYLANDRRFNEVAEMVEKEGELGTMCEVLDQIEARGIAIGEAKGEAKGADHMAKLIRILIPGSKDYEDALNGSNETRQELYKKYNIK